MSTMLKPSKPLSIGLAVAGVAIFFITSMMIRSAGLNSGSTGEGQQLLGWGNIAIHVTGLVLFGTATGYLFRAKHRFFGFLTGLVVMGTALLSMYNLVGFVAAERTSLVKAREAQARAQEEQRRAQLELVKKRQEAQAKLAETQLKWIQGTEKRADGRNERKDSMEAGTKLITEFGKADIAVPDAPKAELVMRPDSGVDLISNTTGISKDLIELISSVYQMLMMIMMESIIWPLAAFFWPPKVATETVTGILEPPSPRPLGGPPRDQKALPAPKGRDKPITIRTEPSAEWRQLLDAVDFPPPGARHKGPERPRLEPEVQALRFFVWLGAYDERGRYHGTSVDDLYYEFLNADHRKETAVRQVKAAMTEVNRGKFASRKQVQGEGTIWMLNPPPIERLKLLLQKAELIPAEPTPNPLAPEPEAEEVEDSQRNVISLSTLWPRRTSTLPN